MPGSHTLSRGIVLTLSAEPLELPPAPLRLLLRLRQLAGHSRRLVTYTRSLATLMGRTPNTIRNWRAVLVERGYIHWLTDPRSGQTTILITEKVEPPSRRARIQEQRRLDLLPTPLPWQPQKPVVLPPDPQPWWRFPAKSSFCLGGAQSVAAIKPREKTEPARQTALVRKWGLLLG